MKIIKRNKDAIIFFFIVMFLLSGFTYIVDKNDARITALMDQEDTVYVLGN